ncbi:atrial natriuretic peptide receptor 3-like [Tachypleus tridentatus]|uniref:atrial natriuretic peptide receptor 3-like n=1 Tax=Tachypleus tridentatus TaxID=6853 RepID=UPI003FD16346
MGKRPKKEMIDVDKGLKKGMTSMGKRPKKGMSDMGKRLKKEMTGLGIRPKEEMIDVGKRPKEMVGIGGRLVQTIYKDTDCSSTTGPIAALDFYVTGTADVFFGPLCPYVLAPVARYSAFWNIPLLTVGGQNSNFDSKYPHYRLMTRMNGSYTQIGHLFLELLRKFHWKTVALLFHDFRDQSLGHSNCFFTFGAVYTALGRQSFNEVFDETKPEEKDFHKLLKEISTKARIILICGSPDTVREILLAAEEINMVQNGEYVFFSIELFTSILHTRNFQWYLSWMTQFSK